MQVKTVKESFEELVKIMETLRSENGCAWDRKQEFETIIECLEKEVTEVKEAIEKKDYENLREELGDVMWGIIFLTQIAKDKGLFEMKEVLDEVKEKIIRRHPHVFGDLKTDDVEEIKKKWQEIKKEEKKQKK
jgi:tetrapyrrole methylase family protein/MazG family protein